MGLWNIPSGHKHRHQNKLVKVLRSDPNWRIVIAAVILAWGQKLMHQNVKTRQAVLLWRGITEVMHLWKCNQMTIKYSLLFSVSFSHSSFAAVAKCNWCRACLINNIWLFSVPRILKPPISSNLMTHYSKWLNIEWITQHSRFPRKKNKIKKKCQRFIEALDVPCHLKCSPGINTESGWITWS